MFLAPFSWTCGITFDSKRKRGLVATLGGEGQLYSFSPAKDEWTLVGSMRNVDAAGITYSSADDRLYAIHSPFGGDPQLELLQYNADGALLKALPILEPWLLARIQRRPPGAHLQLTTLDNQIVAVTSKSPFPNERDLDVKHHIFTIDPQTGDIKMTAEY